jgi:chemotaxis protein histidine kinase CheA
MGEDRLGINTEWLHDVRRAYLSGASRKLAELERAIFGLEMNPTSTAHERRLRRLLHNLIGSGASYGFPAVTDTARGMSECLKRRRDDQSPIDPSILADLRTRLDHLRRIFNDARA